MKTTRYSTTINCSVQKTYKTMLDKEHYKEWTSVFNPASRYKGSWDKGSKIIFLGEDKEGNTGGMVSRSNSKFPGSGMYDVKEEIEGSSRAPEMVIL